MFVGRPSVYLWHRRALEELINGTVIRYRQYTSVGLRALNREAVRSAGYSSSFRGFPWSMPTPISVRQWWKEGTSHSNKSCFWFWIVHWSAIVAGRFLCSEGSCVSQTDAYVLSPNSKCCACYLDRILTQWQYQASLTIYTSPFLHCNIPHEKCFKLEHIKAYGLRLRFNAQCDEHFTLFHFSFRSRPVWPVSHEVNIGPQTVCVHWPVLN